MHLITKWVILLTISILGFVLLIDGEYTKTGVVMAFGGFILFALSLAQEHIKTF